jgi:hypothetical protein
MSVLTDTQRAANDFYENRKPDQVVGRVDYWAWGALYDAFMAGAAFESERLAAIVDELAVKGDDVSLTDIAGLLRGRWTP